MPIEELTDDHLLQRCLGCGSTHAVAHATLAALPAPAEPRVLALPECSACGAHEFLVRSASVDLDAVAPGSYSHLHRLLVDHAHAVVAARRTTSREHTDATMLKPDLDALRRWFPNGFTLPLPTGGDAKRG